jgi:O-antigen/teichoic acid export membrane protein
MRLVFTVIIVLLGITSLEILLVAFTISNVVPLVAIALCPEYRAALSKTGPFTFPSKTIFLFGLSIFCISYFSMIGQYLIKLVISHELGIVWQGYYDVSLTIVGILLFSLGTMKFLTIPEATNSDKNSIYMKGGLADITRLLSAFTILLSLVLILYSRFIVVTIFSADFEIAADYLYILVIGEVFLFIQLMVSHINIAQSEKKSDYLRLTVIPLCIFPLFFYLTQYLIAYFSGAGVGNGFVGAYISYTVLMVLFTVITLYMSKDRGPVRSLLAGSERLAVSSVVPVAIISFFHPGPIPGIFMLMGTFIVSVFLSGYLNKDHVIEMLIPHKRD